MSTAGGQVANRRSVSVDVSVAPAMGVSAGGIVRQGRRSKSERYQNTDFTGKAAVVCYHSIRRMDMDMKTYGDALDIIKWALALEIAYLHDVQRIVHVAMWTDERHDQYPDLNRPAGATARDINLHTYVADHFNLLNGLRSLEADTPFTIEVWPDLFTHATRYGYFREVRNSIRGSTLPTLWLFDPDTGLETEKILTSVHISLGELACAHAASPERDHIVVYQHNTHQPNWQDTARRRLQNVLDGHPVDLYEPPRGQAVLLAIG